MIQNKRNFFLKIDPILLRFEYLESKKKILPSFIIHKQKITDSYQIDKAPEFYLQQIRDYTRSTKIPFLIPFFYHGAH